MGRRAAADAAQRLTARIAAEGLADVSYAPADSPFGTLLLAATSRGLVRLAFPEEDVDSVLEVLARRVSPRILEASAPLDPVRRELEEYFSAGRREFELPLDWTLIGPFGRRVLRVTSEIPYGGVLSYAEVAAEAGSPRGSRAAGNALGSNPIPSSSPAIACFAAAGHSVATAAGWSASAGCWSLRARSRSACSGFSAARRPPETVRYPYSGLCSAYSVAVPAVWAPRAGAHCASAGSPATICSGAGTPGVSRRYHSASSAAWQPDPAAVIAWR